MILVCGWKPDGMSVSITSKHIGRNEAVSADVCGLFAVGYGGVVVMKTGSHTAESEDGHV